jgi:hypothetical protein
MAGERIQTGPATRYPDHSQIRRGHYWLCAIRVSLLRASSSYVRGGRPLRAKRDLATAFRQHALDRAEAIEFDPSTMKLQ